MNRSAAAAAAARRRLHHVLATIAAIDPSRLTHPAGPDTPASAARYAERNTLVYTALALPRQSGLDAGIGYDPTDAGAPGGGLPAATHRAGVLAPTRPPHRLRRAHHRAEVPPRR